MRIKLVSDIHIDMQMEISLDKIIQQILSGTFDTLVIAGDFGSCKSPRYRPYMQKIIDSGKEIIYVAGNHEYYFTNSIGVSQTLACMDVIEDNFHYLDNSEFKVDGVSFFGGTMWHAQRKISPHINDYNHIYDSFSMFRISHDKFIKNLKLNRSDVVITHHAPCKFSLEDREDTLKINQYFYSETAQRILDEKNIPLWLHGHTHQYKSYIYNDTQIKCNPYGYSNEKSNFKMDEIIEV